MKKILLIVIIILILIYFYQSNNLTDKDIIIATDNWINKVTMNHNSDEIANLFCSDGNLVGTVSQVKRKGDDIRLYFEYFAKLPGIKVISKKYNISKVTSNVFINTAFIEWKWNTLDKPIIAQMTFVFRNKCIFQLHSSALPVLNDKLLEITKLS